MQTTKSGPTVFKKTTFDEENQMKQDNANNLEVILATLAPDFYKVWQTMLLYQINPEVLPTVIKSMGDIAGSTKIGEVIIEIRPDQVSGEAVVRRIRSIGTTHLDLNVSKNNNST